MLPLFVCMSLSLCFLSLSLSLSLSLCPSLTRCASQGCRPMIFEPDLVHRQLLYSGVFEVVKIQQSGLPCRTSHDQFLERFK